MGDTAEVQVHRIDWYLTHCISLGVEGFSKEFCWPVLIAREDQQTETEANFHTAFMSRAHVAAALADPTSTPPVDRAGIRAGDVRFVRKQDGAAFADRVGVGRARNADVCIPNPKVSKYHAYFETRDGTWFLTDADSRNGTWVEGDKLEPRKSVKVNDGDEIVFGPHRFAFYVPKGFAELLERRAAR